MLYHYLALGLISGLGGVPAPPGGLVLLVSNAPGTLASTNVLNPYASGKVGVSLVQLARLSAMEAIEFSNLRGNISSGGDGTNNLRLRKNGANANQFATRGPAPGILEDLVNKDTLAALDTYEIQYTDTGTDSVMDWISMNARTSVGHGCPYVCYDPSSTWEFDVPSATRFIPFSGRMDDDGVATIGPTQWKLGANYDLVGWAVQVELNARLNNSVLRFLKNGSPVGNSITYATLEVGRKQDITKVALAKDDLVNYDITLGTGVEDIQLISVECLLKSLEGKSEVMAVGHNAQTRAASGTPTYYRIGGSNGVAATEALARIRPGFAARVEYPRINVVANTYSSAATLEILKNGVSAISLNIGAGATGFIGDANAFTEITAADELSVSITGGGTGSISFHARGFTFAPITGGGGSSPGQGSMQILERRRRTRVGRRG